MEKGSEKEVKGSGGEDEEEEARCKAAMEVEKRVYRDSFQVHTRGTVHCRGEVLGDTCYSSTCSTAMDAVSRDGSLHSCSPLVRKSSFG